MKNYGHFNLYNSYTKSDLSYPFEPKLTANDRDEIKKELKSLNASGVH
jgi:hypothetical protein